MLEIFNLIIYFLKRNKIKIKIKNNLNKYKKKYK